MYFLNVDFLKT